MAEPQARPGHSRFTILGNTGHSNSNLAFHGVHIPWPPSLLGDKSSKTCGLPCDTALCGASGSRGSQHGHPAWSGGSALPRQLVCGERDPAPPPPSGRTGQGPRPGLGPGREPRSGSAPSHLRPCSPVNATCPPVADSRS